MGEQVILEGHISVSAALRSGNRPIQIIYAQRNVADEALQSLASLARAAGVKIQLVGNDRIEAYATGRSHGGIIALAGPRRMLALEELLGKQGAPFIVMVDGVEDPFNFGAAIRSLYAAGADGLVVRPRNWTSAGIVARASAGASELIPTALARTPHEAAAFFRQRGLLIACATHHNNAASLYTADLSVPLFLLIGGEKRGITRSFVERADLHLSIPYTRTDAHSLGAAAATSIIAFEIMRQRRQERARG
ncbi:MAG TPA: RNA methyltransferase [Ktedonobacterales bacterium]|jgi:23S rRNA (guanosine2251-2'-O)-methyltransferase